MGYTTSTVHGIEVPDSSEANNVPEDIGKVVTALEAGSLVRRLTGAAIAALTAPQKPAGLLVYNTTTSRLQISDGSNFADYVAGTPVHAIGVRSGSLSLTYGGYTTVTWTAETDPSAMLGSSTATLPSAGIWHVDAYADCTNSDVSGGYFLLEIRQNSTTIAVVSTTRDVGLNGPDGVMAVSALVSAAASDTISVRVYNTYTSGGQNCTAARMSVVKLGA